MSFDLAGSLRRLKPHKRIAPLTRRADAGLPFAESKPRAGADLLLDTNVYIDLLQRCLPIPVKELLRVRRVHHSSIAAAELAHAFGRLDPRHPDTGAVLAQIRGVIDDMEPRRLHAPSVRATIDAGIVTGIVARLRGLPQADRQPLLNDAMLFIQALENGLCLLTRDVADFDLIQQLAPAGRVLFYRQAP